MNNEKAYDKSISTIILILNTVPSMISTRLTADEVNKVTVQGFLSIPYIPLQNGCDKRI